MRKSLGALAFGVVSFVFIVIVIGKYVIVAQEVGTGEWRADARPERSGKQVRGGLQLSFERVREAGTIECTGSFANGQGLGTFRFVPGNDAFQVTRTVF